MDENEQLLSAVAELLAMMIAGGAEIYRAEESAVMIFSAYGVKRTDVFATTTNLILSVTDAEGKLHSYSRRILHPSTDLERVHRLNDLARTLSREAWEASRIREALKEIRRAKKYPNWLTIPLYGLIPAAYYFFFGGRDFIEAAVALAAGLCSGLIAFLCEKTAIKKILSRFLCSLLMCLIVFSCRALGWIGSIDYIIIANIMPLITGIGLMESLRDLFLGDSVAGTIRFIEAVLAAFAISCGYVVTALVFGGVI